MNASGRRPKPRSDASFKIAIASDHAGFLLKEGLKVHLEACGYEVVDFGTRSRRAVDYPDYIRPAALSVAHGETTVGIVIGGSGNGEAIVSNKVGSIRCAVCWNEESARLAKEHNDANMVSLGARMMSGAEAFRMVDTWLQARFQGGRHRRRLEKIEQAKVSKGRNKRRGL